MSASYVSDEDPERTPIELAGPDDPHFWDEELPSDGRLALIVGDPYGHGAHAVIGTREQLATYAHRITNAVSTGQLIDRHLTLWIHTGHLWRDLETTLGLPRYGLGGFKQWAADRPKHLDGSRYNLDAAISWAHRNGIPYQEERTTRHPGAVGLDDTGTLH